LAFRERARRADHRLDSKGRYRLIEPDGEGRLLSETTGLLFGIAKDRALVVFDARTGKRLLKPSEIAKAQEAAEERSRTSEERALTAEADRPVARRVGEAPAGYSRGLRPALA
jgi:hypothetical protein